MFAIQEEIGENRVAFVIDDRNSVCQIWRGTGFTLTRSLRELLMREGHAPFLTPLLNNPYP